jgi:hypothetical protein
VIAARVTALAVLAGCAGAPRPSEPAPPPPIDAGPDAIAIAAPPPLPPPPRWLRGSTHVHAAPSGDSTTDPAAVIAWYRDHGYDFFVLTDHNRVTTVAPAGLGRLATDDDPAAPLVLAGIELTYNPAVCDAPPPPPGGKCRIHVNALGVTGRPDGKLAWADRAATTRRAMYAAALAATATLGGLAQLNHPGWHWGLTPDLLGALAADGVVLFELANVQFTRWNVGDPEHPGLEAQWDLALGAGATVWAVASDDAHSYDGHGKYPAGGGWVMVDAARDADAIIGALAAGRFYASTGVTLARAAAYGDDLVVEVAGDPAGHTIAFVVDGAVVARHPGPLARHPIPPAGSYVRATVTRADGAQAWVQPVRRPR